MVRALLDGTKTQTRRKDARGWDGFIGRFEQEEPCFLWVKENVWRDPAPGLSPYVADTPVRWGVMKTSLCMPRRLSRLTLQVTAIRRQRLYEIDRADAEAEGVAATNDPVASYQTLWSQLHGADSWNRNPDILAFTFKIVR